MLARAFQDLGQDENNDFKELALYLASEYFMDHSSKDVRLLVACCIADIFRVFAPEAPYTEPEHLKVYTQLTMNEFNSVVYLCYLQSISFVCTVNRITVWQIQII